MTQMGTRRRVRWNALAFLGMAFLTHMLVAPAEIESQIQPAEIESRVSGYRIVDLNLLTTERLNVPRSINLANQIAGRSGITSTRALTWDDAGGAALLPSLGSGDYSAVSGINDVGEMVGSSNTEAAVRAVHWAAGVLRILDVLPSHVASGAYDINNTGAIVGYSSGADGMVAVTWNPLGEVRGLGALPGGESSIAYSINNVGDIAGQSDSSGGKRAVLWTKENEMIDLGTLPGDSSSAALAVNDRRQIVGYSAGSTGFRAVLWEDGKVRSLGTLPGGNFSRALDINNAGIVVGTSTSSHGMRAFRWIATTGMVDLNTLLASPFDHVLSEAHAVNDRGFIVANSGGAPHRDNETTSHSVQHYHAFLLTP